MKEIINELQKVNKQLAKLTLRKEELTQEIINQLDHSHEGQKSYEFELWKIEVKTPFVFSLDKKLYESGKYSLPSEYNPIKESVSYTIDKKKCESLMKEAPKKVRDSLCDLISKKPGKASLSIKDRG